MIRLLTIIARWRRTRQPRVTIAIIGAACEIRWGE